GRHGPKRDPQKALAAFAQASRFEGAPGYIIRLVAVSLAALERREEAIQILEQMLKSPTRDPGQKEQDAVMLNRIRSGEKF
ncbi:MAG TPA: hypothetical protein PKO06_22050, partial [Candidatus Ozemobacteraceae bacterium]|nr:hypothetical protein [Candidatus Ozemobacteraceae bacterium]